MRLTVFASAALLALGLPIATFAAGGGADPPRPAAVAPAAPADPNFAQAKAMIEAKNYANALPLLQQVVQRDPRNADAYNLMGYATRASGNPRGSLQYYQQALAIDARHLGAHEYLGEAYLMLDQPADADKTSGGTPPPPCSSGSAYARTRRGLSRHGRPLRSWPSLPSFLSSGHGAHPGLLETLTCEYRPTSKKN
jgi:tetratricopeptide (TPR) repeat protein